MSKYIQPLGVVRRLDALGRVVVPKSARKMLEWESGTQVEYLTEVMDGQTVIVLRKFDPKRGFRQTAGDDRVHKAIEALAEFVKANP